jgi:ABC-type amino acid transport substrate-binding protein
VWPGNSLTIPSDRPVLEGVTLRIAVIVATPFTMVTYVADEFGKNTTTFIGYMPDLIALLQYNMKFIPQIMMPPSNLTYDKIVQQLSNGVYDMVMGDVTVTAARRQIVDFSNSIFDNSLRIITRKSSEESIDLFSYLRTFTLGLWLMLLAAGLVAAVLLGILEKRENEALQNRSTTSLAVMGMWHSLGVIVGYGVDFHVRTAAGRLLTVGLYIISLVFVATYTANLTSYLTVVKTKDLISSIDDIKNGKIAFNRIGIRLGTSIEDYYLREISHGIKNYYPLTSRQQQYDSLLAGIIDISFMDIGVAEYATNNIYCNLTLVGADFDSSTFGIVIPKQWIYKQDLDVNILLLRESGQLDDLRSKWFQAKTCQDGSNGPTAMKIESLGGLFITFAVISILSIFVLIWTNRYIIKNYLSNLYPHRHKPTREVVYLPTDSIKIRTPHP